jgi:hypothetical protein
MSVSITHQVRLMRIPPGRQMDGGSPFVPTGMVVPRFMLCMRMDPSKCASQIEVGLTQRGPQMDGRLRL